MSKISKKQLRQIIKEERAKLLNESAGHAVGVGFAGWEPKKNPDFAKAYGRDAKTVGHHHQLNEQPVSGGQAQEMSLQQLRDNGAFADLQDILMDAIMKIDKWQQEHEVGLEDAGMMDMGVALEEARLDLDDLRQEAYQYR